MRRWENWYLRCSRCGRLKLFADDWREDPLPTSPGQINCATCYRSNLSLKLLLQSKGKEFEAARSALRERYEDIVRVLLDPLTTFVDIPSHLRRPVRLIARLASTQQDYKNPLEGLDDVRTLQDLAALEETFNKVTRWEQSVVSSFRSLSCPSPAVSPEATVEALVDLCLAAVADGCWYGGPAKVSLHGMHEVRSDALVGALMALAEVGRAATIRRLRERATKPDDGTGELETAFAMLERLATWEEVEPLLEALRDPQGDRDVRMGAARVLADKASERDVGLVIAAMGHMERSNMVSIREVLQRIGERVCPGSDAHKALLGWPGRAAYEQPWLEAVIEIGGIEGLDVIIAGTTHPTHGVMSSAVQELVKLVEKGHREERLIGALCKVAARSQSFEEYVGSDTLRINTQERIMALCALAKLGTAEARSALEEAARDQIAEVKAEAWRLLKDRQV